MSLLLLRRNAGQHVHSSRQSTGNNDNTGTAPGPSSGETPSAPSPTPMIVVAIMVGSVTVILITYLALRSIRMRSESARYIPTAFLKRRWLAWQPTSFTTRAVAKGAYSSALQTPETRSVGTFSSRTAASTISRPEFAHDPERTAGINLYSGDDAAPLTDEERVARHTSVRSVMTLPAYSHAARENERVLGREGERDGVDVVVENPETEQEEEDRREEEMESLYQIRLTRRQEIAEREDRRRRRREARDRGDFLAAEAIRIEAAQAAEQREIAGAVAMIAEHQSKNRSRRVSSVSYAELGVARHDGTRIRANSNESERPLLDSAASIHGHAAGSSLSLNPLGMHHRNRSAASSFLSVSDVEDDANSTFTTENNSQSPRPSLNRANSSDYEVITMNTRTHSRNNSSINLGRLLGRNRSRSSTLNTSAAPSLLPSLDTTGDLGEGSVIPGVDPPSYDGAGFEEAPPYSSPIATRAPTLPLAQPVAKSPSESTPDDDSSLMPPLHRLPSIRIAEATPIDPSRPLDQWPSAAEARAQGKP